MTNERLPEEAIQVALAWAQDPNGGLVPRSLREQVCGILTAALPALTEHAAEQTRKACASAVLAEERAWKTSGEAPGNQSITYAGGLRRAARIIYATPTPTTMHPPGLPEDTEP